MAQGMSEASFVLERYPKDEGELVVEDVVIHREGLGTILFLSEAEGRCVAMHAEQWIVSIAIFCYIVLELHIYGIFGSYRLTIYISFL